MFNIFRDLFRHKEPEQVPASSKVETIPLAAEKEPQADLILSETKIRTPHLDVGVAQSVGKQRTHNEDTLFVMHALLADGVNDMPFGIFVVADGMGGHLNGEIASGVAARTIGRYLVERFFLPFLSVEHREDPPSILEVLESGVREAQHAVVAQAPGGGTTLTAAMVLGGRVTISHVGDSRACFISPGERVQVITQDHSLVRRLQDLGQIDEKEAITHPQRNVLYRALGQSEPFKPDIHTHALPPDTILLLCSDGLWGSVPDDDIYAIVRGAPDLSTACARLIDAANEAGGPDNISAVLVRYLGE